jgi:fucose permease
MRISRLDIQDGPDVLNFNSAMTLDLVVMLYATSAFILVPAAALETIAMAMMLSFLLAIGLH